MILHISCDDQFVRYVDKQFMEGDSSSRIIVCDYHEAAIHSKNVSNVIYIQAYSQAYFKLIESLYLYNGIIFHGLFGKWAEAMIDAIPDSATVAWVIWDGEIFGRPEIEASFYKPLTKCLWRQKKLYAYLRHGFKHKYAYFVPVEKFRKIKYCLCDMPQEASFASQYLKMPLEWVPYNYYSINETVRHLRNKRAAGPNIFLGNSCTYNNNHIDAIWKLRLLITKKQKVITPLSYGNTSPKRLIIRVGKLLLGKSFEPLIDYLPLDEYNTKMLSCSTMIQYLGSPGAQGNIVTGLWLGMRVFLNKQSIMYEFFKSLGAYVYSVEDDLNADNPNLFQPMSDEETTHNRQVVEGYFGQKVIKERVAKIVSLLDK